MDPEFEDLLAEWEERAAIMEFEGGLPRDEAEKQAWVDVFGVEMPDADSPRSLGSVVPDC